MVQTAIALGSNLGDRLGYLRAAYRSIAEDCLVDSLSSRVYETAPWGMLDQPYFLNAVVIGKTDWQPPALLNYLKDLEKKIGRTTRVLNGPREIDLDIVAFGEEVHSSPGVSVPHLRCVDRIFVMKPLCDVWPDWVHPILHRSASEILSQLVKSGSGAAISFNPALVPN